MNKIILTLSIEEDMERGDLEAFGDALRTEINKADQGQMFGGKDFKGVHHHWYIPEFTIDLKVESSVHPDDGPPEFSNYQE